MNHVSFAALRPLAASLLLAGVAASAHAGSYSQGSFNAADWKQVTLVDIGSQDLTMAVKNTGGNPGSYWENTVTLADGGHGGTQTVANIDKLFTYDPAASGALATLDFSFDLSATAAQNIGGDYTGVLRPALMQNGTVYTVFGSDVVVRGGWATYAWSFDTSSNWVTLLPDATAGVGAPDFSAAGSVIQFGYRSSLTTTCAYADGCLPGIAATGLDNYNVSFTSAVPAVPEPGTWGLMATGLVGVFIARRKLAAQASR